jgi:hypothetical protein
MTMAGARLVRRPWMVHNHGTSKGQRAARGSPGQQWVGCIIMTSGEPREGPTGGEDLLPGESG